VSVIGHSDRSGRRDSNQRLALARAQAVKSALIQLGLPPGRITTTAGECCMGDSPIDPAARRTDIVIALSIGGKHGAR
jgi:flagellar motor protein MotB